MLFAGLAGDETHIAFDRAAAELRAGRPLVVETQDSATLVAALDGVTPHVYGLFREFGGRLVISTERAKTLGLKVDYPVALPLRRLDRDAAQQLAITPHLPTPADWEPGSAAAGAALELCKYALLLPAALSVALDSETALPPDLFHIRLDQLQAPATNFDLEIVSEADVPLAGGITAFFVAFWLVKKLSRQITSWPCSTRRSQRWEPRKPAPPVTRMRLRWAMGELLIEDC